MQAIELSPEEKRQIYLKENQVTIKPFATKWRVFCRDRNYWKCSSKKDAVAGAKKLAATLNSHWELLGRKGNIIVQG